VSGINGASGLHPSPGMPADPYVSPADIARALRRALRKRLRKSGAPTWVQANVLRQLAGEVERER